jgi:hypothetical protein
VVAKVLGWPRHEKNMSELIEFCAAPFFGELSAARGFKKVVFARGLRTASNFLSFRQRVRKDNVSLKFCMQVQNKTFAQPKNLIQMWYGRYFTELKLIKHSASPRG